MCNPQYHFSVSAFIYYTKAKHHLKLSSKHCDYHLLECGFRLSLTASCLSSCPIVNVLMAGVVAPKLTAHFINKHQGQKELWGKIVIASNSNNF